MADSQVSHEIEIVTRKDALARGLKYYFTGRPCPHGHVAMRHVGGGCVPCERERVKRRNRDEYANNLAYRAKIAEGNKRRYQSILADTIALEKERARKREVARKARENPEFLAKEADNMREYRKNPRVKARIRDYKKKYYRDNPRYQEYAKEKTREWLKRAKSDPQWVERERARGRDRAKNDPVGNRAKRHRYRAKIKGNGGYHTPEDITHLLKAQNYECVYCRIDIRDGYEVDHIMPLALGGSNWPSNLQCTCRSCNRSKGAKHPDDFAKEKGRL